MRGRSEGMSTSIMISRIVATPLITVADPIDDVVQVDDLRLDLHPPRLDLGEVEDVVDVPEEIEAGGVDVVQEAAVARLELMRRREP